jgi:pyruvate dehydrogenase E2 component (dihydrolipoamide acetyltransferase)
MATEVRLPQLGETMEEGTIVGCMVKVGDEVKKGDVIFEIETDKATLEMESPASGFVKHIVAEMEQMLPVGEALLVLGDKDEEVSQSFIDSLKASAPAVQVPATPTPAPTEPQVEKAKRPGKVLASPRAKKLAKNLGVDLAMVTGTGPAGKITEQDVKEAAGGEGTDVAGSSVEIKLGATIPLSRRQKVIAEQMVKSKREIPCFYLTSKVDVTELAQLKAKLDGTGDTETTYSGFIIKAVATALAEFSLMTGQVEGDVIKLAEAINIGLAVEAPNGVVVPVVKDADKKDVRQIAQETRRLAEKAQNGKLLAEELEGACITVSNPGALGIDTFIPIVIPGQCSGFGVGRIIEACVSAHGDTAIRKLMKLSISVDHKIANGAYAARFLDTVKKLLEDVATFT